MEYEAEPGPTEAVGQDPAGTGGGTGSETAPAEAGGVTGNAAVAEGAVADGEVRDGAGAEGEVGDGAVGDGTAGGAADRAAASGAAADLAAPATPPELTTGEARVDAALKLLDRLSELPVSDHPELFEQVHARLSEVLGELESGPDATGPAGG